MADMRIVDTFRCDIYRDEELVEKKTTDLNVTLEAEKSFIEINQIKEEMSDTKERQHYGSVFYGFDENWVKRITELVSYWLESERTPDINETLGNGEVVVDHSTDERKTGEFSIGLNERGILFLFDTEGTIYEYRIPAGTTKVDGEYSNFDNIRSIQTIFDDFLLTNTGEKRATITETTENPHPILRKIFSNFPRSVRPFKDRRNNRDPIKIEDEYVLQDILESHLRAFFDDVRSEEPVPSRGGAGSDIDFLLKKEGIGIEVKRTRESLEEKTLGEDLSTDIERYQEHPDCDMLYCFIYDPEIRISNPSHLNELEQTGAFPVKIAITPD